MPINTIRLNHQKSSHPNDRIIFIKPLQRPPAQQAEYDVADTFLRAIAAQCLPITKKHWLAVTTLEEYEPNREFMGRNFNHGECIQLVLRSKGGRWLPFNMVQMVMMHELAHNAEMNHSKRFWAKRNEYAGEMRELWAKGYTGEGFWGSGSVLGDMSNVMGNNVLASEELGDLPLCGGTFRSRKRKRRAATGDGKELTWKEKKARRIEKKFGKNGVSLGGDEDTRMLYEIGNKGTLGGNPRVAQSKRGRELRAAAALARFEQSKQDTKNETIKDEDDLDSDDYEDVDAGMEDATDLNGQRLLDQKGRSMVRICDDEDVDDVHVKQEMEELEGLEQYFSRLKPASSSQRPNDDPRPQKTSTHTTTKSSQYDDDRNSDATTVTPSPSPEPSTRPRPSSKAPVPPPTSIRIYLSQPQPQSNSVALATSSTPQTTSKVQNAPTASPAIQPPTTNSTEVPCQICSLLNPALSPTCAACGHVMGAKKDPRSWVCACQMSQEGTSTPYRNAGDVGVCGLCGARRPGS